LTSRGLPPPRQLDHVADLLAVRIVPNQNDLKPPLTRPQRGENGLSPFKVFHVRRSPA
jgi:hypothetical protein